jgi:hypothetical protein
MTGSPTPDSSISTASAPVGHDEVLPPCGHLDESMWLGYAYAAVSEQPEDVVLVLGQASHGGNAASSSSRPYNRTRADFAQRSERT